MQPPHLKQHLPAWFYGWNILGVAFFVQCVITGATQYAYSVLIVSIANEFNAPIFKTMLALTAMSVMTGLLSIRAGSLLQANLRRYMLIGTVCLTVGFTLVAFTTALWQVIVLYGSLIALGSTLTAPLATSTLLSQWFTLYRGRALSIAAIGTSLGGFIFPPLTAYTVEHLGWRETYLFILAGANLLLVVIVYLLVINRPENCGLWPDNQPPSESSDSGQKNIPDNPHWTTATIIRSPRFWLIAGAIGLAFSVFMGITANLIPHANSLGISTQYGALLLSCIAISGIIGKLTLGLFTDRWGVKKMFLVALALNLVACLLFYSGEDYYVLFTACVILGLSTAGLLPIWPGFIADQFGRDAFSHVMGLMSPIVMTALVTGAPIAGWLYDRTGSYEQAFIMFGAVLIVSALLARLLPATNSTETASTIQDAQPVE